MEALLDEPALDPPLGVVPNFAHPSGSQSTGYGFVIASSIISTIAVLARLTSSIALKKFLLEDLLMVAALGIFAGYQYIFYDLNIYPGIWAHQWNIQNRSLIHFLYDAHLGEVFYGPVAMCIKVAILVNWLRIFVPAHQRNATFWTLHTLIWINILYYSITTLTGIFRCSPMEAIWNPFFEGGRCSIDVEVQYITTSVLNFISDTAILAMPQWSIWNLQMSRNRKWGLSFLFVIGIGAWTFGVIRTVYFVKLLSSHDAIYQLSNVGVWTMWEVTIGFLIMGIPAFPKAAKVLPMSDSIASFFRSLSGHSNRDGLRLGNPQRQLDQPKPRRHRSLWEISEIETHDLVSTRSAENENVDNRRNDTQTELVTNEGRSEVQIV